MPKAKVDSKAADNRFDADRTCDCFGYNTVHVLKLMGLKQAELVTASGLIQNATASEPSAAQTYLAAVNWKSPYKCSSTTTLRNCSLVVQALLHFGIDRALVLMY
ncbi:unnamed protein product [Trifolium pratense]|uniref:Uncharacterized protein n=1 Tax=Trifolium pratense TaxID=57577 RepID=A0ACB0KLW7_TRIPR|nr:unnamed protein product [Trifolium pratense]